MGNAVSVISKEVKDELCDCLGQVTCPAHGDSASELKQKRDFDIEDLHNQLADAEFSSSSRFSGLSNDTSEMDLPNFSSRLHEFTSSSRFSGLSNDTSEMDLPDFSDTKSLLEADLNGENVRLCDELEVPPHAASGYQTPSTNRYKTSTPNRYKTSTLNRYQTSFTFGYQTPSTNGYQIHPAASVSVPSDISCAVYPVCGYIDDHCSDPSLRLHSADLSSALLPSYEGESFPSNSVSIAASSIGSQAPSDSNWCNLFHCEPHSSSESESRSSSYSELNSIFNFASSSKPQTPFGIESQIPRDRKKQTTSGSELHNSSGSEYSAAELCASPVFKIPHSHSRQMDKNDTHSVKEILQRGVPLMETLPRFSSTYQEPRTQPRTQPMFESVTAEFYRQYCPQYPLWSNYGVCTASICSESANISHLLGDIFKPQQGRYQPATSQNLPWDRDSCVRMFDSLLSN